MAYDTKLAERIRETLPDRRTIKEKEMFGGICFLSDDKMFVGVVKDELMARVGPENADQAIQLEHVRRMDFTGKPMAGYIFVAPEGLRGSKLGRFLAMSLDFVATVKKKPKRARKKAAAIAPMSLRATKVAAARGPAKISRRTSAPKKASASVTAKPAGRKPQAKGTKSPARESHTAKRAKRGTP